MHLPTKVKISLAVVGVRLRVGLLLALHEAATLTTRVLVANLVDLKSVITAVEHDDEVTGLIIRLGGDELSVEAEHVHILLEHLLHVDLGGLGLQGEDGAKRVLRRAVTVVGRDLGLGHDWHGLRKLDGVLLDTHVVTVPSLSEVITVVDEALATIDDDLVAADEVSGTVVLLALEAHAGAVSKNGGLGESLLLKEHREGETARVLGVDLLDLNLTVRKVVVEDVELVTTVVGAVLPKDVEGQNLAVVVEEGLESLVRATTLKLHLDVLLDLSLIRRSLLVVNHGASVSEVVIGLALRSVQGAALVLVETSREVIAVNNSEDTLVHVQVAAQVEISPGVVSGLIIGERKLVSLEEDALGDTRVLNARLDDVKGVVIKVIEDDALADAEVFVGVFDDGLLEESVELEDLQLKRKMLASRVHFDVN